MKQYVLNEPALAAPATAEPEAMPLSLRQPGWWRWLLLAAVVETAVLAGLFVALTGGSSASQAAPSSGIAYAAAFSFPRQEEPAPGQAVAAEPKASTITQEGGRYVVDLHDAPLDAALAMLTQATKARVTGSAIFAGSPLRLTSSIATPSPREAWQVVFGGVSNFAIACAGSACEVRFVSLVKPGAPAVQAVPQAMVPAVVPTVQADAGAGAPPGQGVDSTEN